MYIVGIFFWQFTLYLRPWTPPELTYSVGHVANTFPSSVIRRHVYICSIARSYIRTNNYRHQTVLEVIVLVVVQESSDPRCVCNVILTDTRMLLRYPSLGYGENHVECQALA